MSYNYKVGDAVIFTGDEEDAKNDTRYWDCRVGDGTIWDLKGKIFTIKRIGEASKYCVSLSVKPLFNASFREIIKVQTNIKIL
jgi:hypothetical protein